jgi:hypothetical protein
MTDEITLRARELREELEQLGRSDHPLAQEQRRLDLIAAYRRERVGVTQRLARAQAQGAEREMVHDLDAPGGMRLGRTGNQRALELAETLASIDGEIARLTREGE